MVYHYQAFAANGRADVSTNGDASTTNGDSSTHVDKKVTCSPSSSPSHHNPNPTTIDDQEKDNSKDTATTTCPDGSKLIDNGKCKTIQPHPDDDCLFNPSLNKCKAIDGSCPSGFGMNENGQCFPDKPCPKGFERHNEDETGTCYPVKVQVDCSKNPKDPSCPLQPPRDL